jgi:hypothetical protein
VEFSLARDIGGKKKTPRFFKQGVLLLGLGQFLGDPV